MYYLYTNIQPKWNNRKELIRIFFFYVYAWSYFTKYVLKGLVIFEVVIMFKNYILGILIYYTFDLHLVMSFSTIKFNNIHLYESRNNDRDFFIDSTNLNFRKKICFKRK